MPPMSALRKPATMRDVAHRAGVSIQTVSAVINGKPAITRETTERVRAAIQELGYRPFAIAQSLRTGQTRSVALIVSDIANPSFATLASAAEDFAHARGYALVLYNTHDDIVRETGYIHAAVQRWLDGALFVSAEDKATSLDAFAAAGIPVVAIDRIPEGYAGPSVTLDNVKAGRMAAEHLLGLGHTNLAHISGPLRLRLARERLAGFRQAIEERGLSMAACTGGEGSWECAAGSRAMREILARSPRPTAVFSANDRMAIGAVRAIHEAGLRVPDDISVVGLDDIEVAAYQNPPLTTVRQSFARLGAAGLQLLLEIVAGETPAQTQIVMAPELVVRRSTRACAAG